jgi:predicted amidohydrolase YtcJ
VLDHTSGHCVWVNGAALRAAGITRDTASPAGGAIDVDDQGEPTGILRDKASALIAAVAPRPSPAERIDALQDAISHAHSLGVTGAHAMNVGRGEYQAMLALHDSGRLRLRIRAFLTAERINEWIDRAVRTGDGDAMMRIGGVKFFADGALGSMTAWMREPYAHSNNIGFPLQPPEELHESVTRCLQHGLAPAIHAIGDQANRATLDILERTRAIAQELPRRIEHAQLLDEADIGRFAPLGVTASMQPIHATQDMAKVDRAWGNRGDRAYAFASLAAAGVNLAFGSDTPVEMMDPLAGIHAGVTRRNAAGEPAAGWHAEQRLPLEGTVRAYTHGAAVAVREERQVGAITAGMHADAVVLSRNLFEMDDRMEILDACVDATIVGGEIVYARAD